MLTSSKRVPSNTETYTAVPESRGDKLTAFQGLYTVQAKPQFPVKPGAAPNIQSQTQSMKSPNGTPPYTNTWITSDVVAQKVTLNSPKPSFILHVT